MITTITSQEPLSIETTRQRNQTIQTTQRLALASLRQWEKALSGVVAVPAALALSTAACATFAASLVEGAFEILDSSLSDIGKRVGHEFDAIGERREKAS